MGWLRISVCLRWKSWNYLLNANFGKMSDEGWGGLFQVTGFAFHPCMFFLRVARFVCGLHNIRFFPGTCLQLHLGADPPAGLWTSSSRQGSKGKLAEEWGSRVPWSGRRRQPSLRASDYRGWEGDCTLLRQGLLRRAWKSGDRVAH